MKVKLFVSHRIDQQNIVLKNDILTPVYCGAVYKKDKWQPELIGDNTGDNISEKRMSYCELTVQYWAWKNVEADYYGLCHYRRYLAFGNQDGWRNEQNQIYLPTLSKKSIEKYKFSDNLLIKTFCKQYDAIFPEAANVINITVMGKKPKTVLELWKAHEKNFFDIGVLEILLRTIQEVQPEYYDIAIKYLKSDKHRGYNCYLMSRHFFVNLCQFQFTILNKLEERIPEEALENYPRTIGYMGEILFGIYQHYITTKKSRIINIPLVLLENTNLKFNCLEILSSWNMYYAKKIAMKYLPRKIIISLKKIYHIIK